MTTSRESLPASRFFAVRKTWKGAGPFSQDDDKEHVEIVVAEAPDAEAAIQWACSRSSVLSLEYGVTLEAVEIYWSRASRRFAKYDGEPLNDNHTATGAKLVIGKSRG